MTKLTIKQKKFADEYIISGNAYQAAINAGYSENYAKNASVKLLEKGGKILGYINKKMAEIEDQQIAKQDEVLKYVTSVMRGKETEQKLAKNEFGGEDVVDIQVSAKDRIKAAELLGKLYGSWTEKVEIEAESRVVIVDDLED